MAIDIPSLFRDVIETPEQRQQRQMLERLNQAQSFMAPRGSVASLLNPLAGATFMNIAESQDRVKENLGGMLGLDMRDTSQKVSDELLGADLSSSTGMRDLSKAINRYAPAQAIGLLQAADEREQAEAERRLSEQATLQSIAESKARESQAQENVRRSVLEQVESAAKETADYINAQNIFSGTKNILQKVSPFLANEIQTLFPPTLEGAQAARDFALEVAKSPEEQARQFREVTIVNQDTGNPEIVLFDDNDPTYKRVIGVDASALEANSGRKFGNLQSKTGTPLTNDAFNATSFAKKLLNIAFDENLEKVVGPLEVRRAFGQVRLDDDLSRLVKDIEISQTEGVLPIIRLFAPVTDVDKQSLIDLQLSTSDSQETWIKRTIEENLPKSLNIMERSLAEDGQGLSASHQLRLALTEEILRNIVNKPGVFQDYSLEDAASQAISLLPNVNNININEIPKNITVFKSPMGTVYSSEIIEVLRQRNNQTQEEILKTLDLELIER